MKKTAIVCLVAIGVAAPAVALADTAGTPGRLASLRLRGPASDGYGQSHGNIVVDEGKGVLTTYVWGGSNCPSANFTDALAGHLYNVLGNAKLRIVPIYKLGQGAALCLVQVLTPEKKYVDDIAPLP